MANMIRICLKEYSMPRLVSMACTTLATLAKFATETLLYQVVQTVAKSFKCNLVNHLAHEGSHEELACFNKADTTLLHVEEGILVELAYGSAVAALHIVGIDLELRLSIHACLACEA